MTDARRERYAAALYKFHYGVDPAEHPKGSDGWGGLRDGYMESVVPVIAVADADNSLLRGELKYAQAKREDNWREVVRLRAETEIHNTYKWHTEKCIKELGEDVTRLRAELAALQEKDDTVLSEAERDMLGFALSQAQEVMDSRSAEFTADDHAAWEKLRRLAD